FADDHLRQAIARLYQRYADLLPDGPARTRAAATARSVAAFMGAVGLDRCAPDLEAVDHRVLGTWSAHGAEEQLQHNRSLLDVAADVVMRDEDVLGLRSDALLMRRTHRGTARAGGGSYEREYLWLSVFGADGLITRIEYFDPDRDDDAIARFDELTAAPSPAA